VYRCPAGEKLKYHYTNEDLSIGPSAVFGTCGPARRADTSLNIRSISPHRKSSPI
jgi:hypothetical protein